MNDSVIFQGLARAMSAGAPPMGWPLAMWKTCFVDCPMAVAAHLQHFTVERMQERAQLIADLSHQSDPSTAFARTAAFAQQSAVAWNTEMLELAELVQSRLLAAAQADPAPQEPSPSPLARAGVRDAA